MINRPLRAAVYELKKWIYRGGRPGRIARLLNDFWSRRYAVSMLGPRANWILNVPVIRSSASTASTPPDHQGTSEAGHVGRVRSRTIRCAADTPEAA